LTPIHTQIDKNSVKFHTKTTHQIQPQKNRPSSSTKFRKLSKFNKNKKKTNQKIKRQNKTPAQSIYIDTNFR